MCDQSYLEPGFQYNSMLDHNQIVLVISVSSLTVDAGLMIDHGTGIVIGETAVIGKNCSFLHGVTLGSTGKERGDRHPKIGNDVLIGCNATILGNIRIGNCCKIGSGTILLMYCAFLSDVFDCVNT